MTDLSKLNLRKGEEQLLINQGFSTIESIAVASRSDLGLSKNKAKQVISSAQTIFLNDHILKIKIDDGMIYIFVDEISDTLEHCIVWQFAVWDDPNDIQVDEQEKCYSYPSSDMRESQAEKWITKLDSKQAENLKQCGITIPESKIRSFAEGLQFEGFWQTVFQEIKGNDLMKKALTIALFSTFDEPCHICILGDPASAKSLSYDLIVKYFPDVVSIGANSTRSGLVINLSSGELGALATSDQRIIIADEFDKIPKADIPYTFELLSNGKCRVDSARIHDTIISHFILIALGNPKKEVFGNHPIEQISLPPALMSRFALIIRTELLTPEDRMEVFKKKFYRDFEQVENPELFVQWVRLARTFQPDILVDDNQVEQYIQSIGNIVNGYYHSPLRRDMRMGDYLRRIPFCIARANFADVTLDTLRQAEQIIKESIGSWKK